MWHLIAVINAREVVYSKQRKDKEIQQHFCKKGLTEFLIPTRVTALSCTLPSIWLASSPEGGLGSNPGKLNGRLREFARLVGIVRISISRRASARGRKASIKAPRSPKFVENASHYSFWLNDEATSPWHSPCCLRRTERHPASYFYLGYGGTTWQN